MTVVIEWDAPCDREGCTALARWRNDAPPEDPVTLREGPLAPLKVTCPACDTTVAVWTEPAPSAPKVSTALAYIAQKMLGGSA